MFGESTMVKANVGGRLCGRVPHTGHGAGCVHVPPSSAEAGNVLLIQDHLTSLQGELDRTLVLSRNTQVRVASEAFATNRVLIMSLSRIPGKLATASRTSSRLPFLIHGLVPASVSLTSNFTLSFVQF